jgi:hypothetical protein
MFKLMTGKKNIDGGQFFFKLAASGCDLKRARSEGGGAEKPSGFEKDFFQPKGGEQLESASTAGGGCRHGQRPQERIGQLDHRK